MDTAKTGNIFLKVGIQIGSKLMNNAGMVIKEPNVNVDALLKDWLKHSTSIMNKNVRAHQVPADQLLLRQIIIVSELKYSTW